MAPAAPVTTATCPASGGGAAPAQLRLFERPVFDVEQVLLGDAGEAPDALSVRDDLDGSLRDVGGDGGRLGVPARGEEADARRQQHARGGVQRRAAVAGARIAALEIGEIVRPELADRRLGLPREFVQRACPRCRQQHRPGLDPERMVGRDGAGKPVAGDLRAVHETPDMLAAAEGQHETHRLALRVFRRPGEQAAQQRSDLFRPCRPLRQRGACEDLCRGLGQMRFRAVGEPDHALIGLARGLAEGEGAVVQQDHRLAVRLLLEQLRGFPGEREARHDVGDQHDVFAEDLAAERRPVRLVGQRQHGVGVGVVDIAVRQEGVQQGLDRGGGRGRVEQVGPVRGHHVLVGERVPPP